MTSQELRQKFLDFFVQKGHKIIPSVSLVPENDPTTLFTSSGMQQLVPYLKGKPHQNGKRLTNSQPCLRVEDIEEVGDNRHTTFFEMLGNWSLGDYFKKEQLSWIWEFLTKELGLPKEKLYVSVFRGNDKVPKDEESYEIWKDLGVSDDQISFYGIDKNWWSRLGPPDKMPVEEIGGPDCEIFYEFTQVEHNRKYGDKCHPNCGCGKFLEIGNSVFIQYQKQNDGSLKELSQKNVDFGGGLERLATAVMNQPDIFQTDLFLPVFKAIVNKYFSGAQDENLYVSYPVNPRAYANEEDQLKDKESTTRSVRIIADHIRAATFLIKDGVIPSNKEQGYVLRRLLRRSAIKLHALMRGIITSGELIHLENFHEISDVVINTYGDIYFDPEKDKQIIGSVINDEINRFRKTLYEGLKEVEKIDSIDGKKAFDLYQTFGFPYEVTEELFRQKGQKIDKAQFEEEFRKHQELSRTASAGMFKGGLAEQSEIVTKYHTATHLLHAALRKILGEHVGQKGSNITAERLRFDFTHPEKLTGEQLKQIEDLVNQKIKENLPVSLEVMDKQQALKSRALGFFEEKYREKVTVYTIGGFSKEICGGPHVDFTAKLGKFKIIKEKPAAAGIRRIYATLQ